MRLLREFPAAEVTWNATAAEHVVTYAGMDGPRAVWYPTPLALKARLDTAAEAGAGVAVWELGQGFPALFDVF